MLEIGTLLDGKYKILSEIGRGGMSIVYMAINERANKTWAVKELRRDGILCYEAVKQGLLAETEILKRLRHNHLPSIVDVIEEEDGFYIVMDYIEGRSLGQILKEEGPQSQQDVIRWGKKLCDALGYLHSQEPKIIYRDMKPSNVMLKPDGDVMLIDFGIAREWKANHWEDTTCLGTVGYAAPEQFGGMGQTDARTDIYCLGATLSHLVTGCEPSEMPYEIGAICQCNPELSRGLEVVLRKCTRRNPAERYQSAEELRYALEHYGEMDATYQKRQKGKLVQFLLVTLAAIFFGIFGMLFRYGAAQKAWDQYSFFLDEAEKTTDRSQKIRLYQKSMDIPEKAGEKEAYLGMMQVYQEDDVRFSVEEAEELTKCIKNREKELKNRLENYIEVCFEMGKMYWYYFDYGDGAENQMTRAKSAIPWFQDVVEYAPEEYSNRNTAKAYYSIGRFYRDIASDITEADDRGKYKPFFEDIEELLETVAGEEGESEIVRLELLELARNALHQFVTKFKEDGITRQQAEKMLGVVTKTLDEMRPTVDKTKQKKEQIQSLLPDTKQVVKHAYETAGFGLGY